ncbi:hypothetical protein GC176_25720 [bacterium]|nr:hypothetical protein [bacterium]
MHDSPATTPRRYRQNVGTARRLIRALIVIIAALNVAGCSGSGGLIVSGVVMLDGRPTVSELLFEPLAESGRRRGQSVTVTSASDGSFSAELPASTSVDTPLPCRIVIRVPRSSKGVSSAFDYDALPDKVVELRRDLTAETKLTLLLTL